MTDATWLPAPISAPQRASAIARDEGMTRPAPAPLSAPVLIGDVATPLAGETLLSLLWKRLDRDAG